MKLSGIVIVISSLIWSQLFGQITYIKAEESKNRYIRVQEVTSGEYLFEECTQNQSTLLFNCSPLMSGKTFRRYQLREVVEKNERNMAYAAAADVVVVAASFYFAWILAAKATAVYYLAAGVSLDGGVAAGGGALIGTPVGAVTGSAITIGMDDLDPFVHRDISIAVESVMDEASQGDLDDVDSEDFGGGTLVVVEDISFEKLRDRIVHQLSSL